MARFRIDAIADPQSLPRIAGLFAQRAIVPAGMAMRAEGGRLRIEIAAPALPPAQAAIVAAKLGESFAVITVEIDEEAVT